MKKTYIKPEMEMETIELENILALSLAEGPAKTDADDFDGPLMEGKDRGESLWNGLW